MTFGYTLQLSVHMINLLYILLDSYKQIKEIYYIKYQSYFSVINISS